MNFSSDKDKLELEELGFWASFHLGSSVCALWFSFVKPEVLAWTKHQSGE